MSNPIREIDDYDVDRIFQQLVSDPVPVVMRGIASRWPLVEKALKSPGDAQDYLRSLYKGAPVHAFMSESDIGGRIFYTDDLADNNFQRVTTQMDWVLDKLQEIQDSGSGATLYMGSAPIDLCLPGLS